MQLRRAMEIVNTKDNSSHIYYKENPVQILSVDNNIGTAYVETLKWNRKIELLAKLSIIRGCRKSIHPLFLLRKNIMIDQDI